MADEKNAKGNGKNGKSVGILERIKEDIGSLKTDLPAGLPRFIDDAHASARNLLQQLKVTEITQLRAGHELLRLRFRSLDESVW